MTRSATAEVVERFVAAVSTVARLDEATAAWRDELLGIARLTSFRAGDVLVRHHAVADSIHFLVEGRLRYQHLVLAPEQGESLSHERAPWMPVGWSSLHSRRHRVTIVAETDGRLLTIPYAGLEQLAQESPTLWAHVSAFMFRIATEMLWVTRGTGRPAAATGPPASIELVEAVDFEPDALHDVFRQSGCFSSLPPACREWLAEHGRLYRAEQGTQIVREGAACDGLWLLHQGRVSLRYAAAADEGEREAIRFAGRPGALVCWSGLTSPIPAPFGVDAVRDTTLAFVRRQTLVELLDHQPAWVAAIFEQQLWQLRNDLASTRTQYGDSAEDGGIGALRDLIEDSGPLLEVSSGLYGVPHLLAHRTTRNEGFERLYWAHFHGTESETAVSGLALELLRDLERGHRFFDGMQSTYSAVVRNNHLDATELRKLSSRWFRRALTHVPYAIKGLENLPDDPNCIVIYNHMAYAEDSILPNGFLFNPDSHFVSSVLLEPKYGDGIRVSRANDATEYWRADYYERQGHISVVTPESGWRKETPEEKERRKQQFFDDCAAVLASGRPFAIAPEGTITAEESATEASPGPLRAGAFLMSAQLPSRPKIVPVALANFDKPAHRAVFSCVIKPAFSMEERGVDVTDRTSLRSFLESYRQEFRAHVEEAIELAAGLGTPQADLRHIETNLGEVDTVHEEFEHDVRALELRSRRPAGEGGTVFYGSSTFRMWASLAEDVAIPGAVNLGFGGSTFEACSQYFGRLVLPYAPARLIVYSGENDLARGASAELVIRRFAEFAEAIQASLPRTACWFVSIKPRPGRDDHNVEVRHANAGIAAEVGRRTPWRFVDWYRYMVDDTGRPDPQLYAADQIHINVAGYGVLTDLLRHELSTTG